MSDITIGTVTVKFVSEKSKAGLRKCYFKVIDASFYDEFNLSDLRTSMWKTNTGEFMIGVCPNRSHIIDKLSRGGVYTGNSTFWYYDTFGGDYQGVLRNLKKVTVLPNKCDDEFLDE